MSDIWSIRRKHIKCPFCSADMGRRVGKSQLVCTKCGATERRPNEMVKPDNSNTMAKIVTDWGFKLRLLFDWHNFYLGIHWDIRPSGLNIWLCLLPFYTIQIVFGEPKDKEKKS